MLLIKVWSKKSVYGLSSDTQICFFASTLSRVVWSLDTRLVEVFHNSIFFRVGSCSLHFMGAGVIYFTKKIDYIYYLLIFLVIWMWPNFWFPFQTYLAYAELVCSTLVSAFLCFSVWKFRHTTTKEALWPLRSITLIPVALALGLFFHPGSSSISLQVLVAFTMYIEAMALLPQLYLMRKMIEVLMKEWKGKKSEKGRSEKRKSEKGRSGKGKSEKESDWIMRELIFE